MTTSLKSQGAWRTAVSVLVRLAFAVGCFVLALWGRGFCRDVIESVTAPGPGAGFNVVAIELSWLLFFGPFVLLGAYLLVRAGIKFHSALVARQRREGPEVLPPLPIAATALGESSARFRTHVPAREPLDDATKRRLDLLAARAAKVGGVVIGMSLVAVGAAGFLLAWVQGHRPPMPGRLVGYSFILRLLILCGISVLVGAYILRETFARPDTGWLGPLRVFNSIVGHKLAQEEQQRRNTVSSPRKLPPDNDPDVH